MAIQGFIFIMQATFILFACSCPESTSIPGKDYRWVEKSKVFSTPRKVAYFGGLPAPPELFPVEWILIWPKDFQAR
jgi:hypothetical protein